MSAPLSRRKERVGGLFLFALGVALTLYVWYAAARETNVLMIGVVMGPTAVVMGAALLLFPGYRTERLARGESLDGLDGWALLTPRWKAVAAVALVAALGNWLLVQSGLAPAF